MENVKKPHYLVIACKVLFREVCFCAAKSKNIIDISFLPQGLHDLESKKMNERIQKVIDNVNISEYDAILLAYGLCNNGTQGLHADIPLVIPRVHDCIALLMGSKEDYKTYFFANPGTYYLSSGWLERDDHDYESGISSQNGLEQTLDYYRELYDDEETAQYLYETLGNTTTNYQKITFIDNGIGDVQNDIQLAREQAKEKEWEFEKVTGNNSLIESLLSGNWDNSKYLVLSPGERIEPSNNDNIMRAKRVF